MNRNHNLDALRLLAISLVVMMHAPLPGSAPGTILASISYATAPCIGLLFMVSGALLLGNNMPTRKFMTRRFDKIAWPTLFWSIIYIYIKHLTSTPPNKLQIQEILSIPFSAQGHGVLWFMYTLAGLYLLTPILNRWLRQCSSRELVFYLSLWTVSLCYPYLSHLVSINNNETGPLYYFSGYVGYYVLGYYLRYHYKPCTKAWRIHLVACIAIAVIIPILVTSCTAHHDFYKMLWYLSLPVAAMSFGIFSFINRHECRLPEWCSTLSRLSFGVYLVHILVMRHIVWKSQLIQAMSGVSQIIAIAAVTLLSSFLLTWLLSKLPFSKYIIGV